MMKVPTRRFGRTGVDMPVLSCGGMRYQQGWDELAPDKIDPKGQENLEACIHHSLEWGINHIETARGYGPSEMQLGWVLPKLERDTFMAQTKIGVKDSAEELIEAFEVSMKNLQLEYVDFLAIHGINTLEQLENCLKKGGCLDGIKQLQKEGRVRFRGFSTHAGPEVIVPTCETGEFDYANLHWYFIYDALHWPMVHAASKMDMGVFIISPNDKGGQLYHPTEQMKARCAPLTPMQWHDLYCLSRPEVHTLSVGAARPSDLDEHAEAVCKHLGDPLVGEIEGRIHAMISDQLGEDWAKGWHVGIPHYSECPEGINVREILRLWTFERSGVIREFASDRYNLMGTAGEWFPGSRPPDSMSTLDWSCLSASPFAARIPAILDEARALYHRDKEEKRLSES